MISKITLEFFEKPWKERRKLLALPECEDTHYPVVDDLGNFICADCGAFLDILIVKRDLRVRFPSTWTDEWQKIYSLKQKIAQREYNSNHRDLSIIEYTNDGFSKIIKFYE